MFHIEAGRGEFLQGRVRCLAEQPGMIGQPRAFQNRGAESRIFTSPTPPLISSG